MTIVEAARVLGVSQPFIVTLAKRGQLRIIRNPLYKRGPVHIPREDVERLLARKQGSAA